MHCVEGLSRLDAERASTCRMLSFGEDRSGLEKLLAWCDADQTLHARGQRQLQVASRCKDQNERNGAVVALKRSQVQKTSGNAARRRGRAGIWSTGGAL